MLPVPHFGRKEWSAIINLKIKQEVLCSDSMFWKLKL
jgi:hypothetical protein